MSFMRVPHYVYVGGDAEDEARQVIYIDGTPMELSVFDELVVMRLAQLSPAAVTAAAERAVERYGGNIGCNDLCLRRGAPGFTAYLTAMLNALGTGSPAPHSPEEPSV